MPELFYAHFQENGMANLLEQSMQKTVPRHGKRLVPGMPAESKAPPEEEPVRQARVSQLPFQMQRPETVDWSGTGVEKRNVCKT